MNERNTGFDSSCARGRHPPACRPMNCAPRWTSCWPAARGRRRIIDVETRPLPYASSFAIEELDVRFDDGSRVDLVCKDTSDAAMLPEARRIKPGFLYNPLREIATYESILAPLGISAPQFYGSVIDPAARPLLALP